MQLSGIARNGGGGLGVLPNLHPGTYSDVNCPTWCWLVGNVVDTTLSDSCWPCHNQCPSGLAWDTTNNKCSANPVSSNSDPNIPEPAATPSIFDLLTDPFNSANNGLGIALYAAIGIGAFVLLKGMK